MEPSATSTTVIGPVGERLQAGTEDATVYSTARRNWDVFMILAPDINMIHTYFLTYLRLIISAPKSIRRDRQGASKIPPMNFAIFQKKTTYSYNTKFCTHRLLKLYSIICT